MHRYASVESALDALAGGRILIVADSEERENEGDFLAAAEFVTPEIIHFMISHGRGQLCLPVSRGIAQRLDFTLMVPPTNLATPRFAIPVDHRDCATGISPVDRSLTIQAILDSSTSPEDFVRPGHIFPLIAHEEGVLCRPGHTEATVDLTRLAGLKPAGVLCEICSRDGRNMACGDELWELAEAFDLPVVTIDALIDYRRRRVETEEESLLAVHRLAEF